MLDVKTYKAKSTPQKTVISFDNTTQQDNFTRFLEDLAWDLGGNKFINVDTDKISPDGALYFNLPAVKGVNSVVRLVPRIGAAGGDPITAIANAVGTVGEVFLDIKADKRAKASKQAELEAIQAEERELSPMVNKIYETYPFIKDYYQPRHIALINDVHRVNNDWSWAHLSNLLRNVINSVTQYSKHKADFVKRVYYPYTATLVDFSDDFSKYFKENAPAPPAAKPSESSNGNNNQAQNQSSISPVLIIGGIFIASQIFSKKVKR